MVALLLILFVFWVVVRRTVSFPVQAGLGMGLAGFLLVHRGVVWPGWDLVEMGLFLDLETGKARGSHSEP